MSSIYLVHPDGIEPPSSALQAAAMTTSAKGANLGRSMGIEPILPRSQRGVQTTTLATPLVPPEGLEPPTAGSASLCSNPSELRRYNLVPLERFELPTAGFEDQNSSAELQWLGRGYRIRTCAWRNQNPLPYQLGESPTNWSRWRESNPRRMLPKHA